MVWKKRKTRTKGAGRDSKNLIRKDDYIINQHGVKISLEEQRQLRNAVQTVNRKRKKLLDEYGEDMYEGKKKLRERRTQLMLMGEELDMIPVKRSTALQDFETRGDFDTYLKSAKRAAKVDYLEERIKLYRQNLKLAFEHHYAAYPEMVKGITMKIQMMPRKQLESIMASNRLLQIKYVYSSDGQIGQLNQVREFLGLKPMYEDYDME